LLDGLGVRSSVNLHDQRRRPVRARWPVERTIERRAIPGSEGEELRRWEGERRGLVKRRKTLRQVQGRLGEGRTGRGGRGFVLRPFAPLRAGSSSFVFGH